MLAVTLSTLPVMMKGSARAERRRSAALSASSGLAAGEQQDEFVAADTRQHVVFTAVAAEPVGNLDDERVAGFVPQRVVDRLEAVQVDEKQTKGAL